MGFKIFNSHARDVYAQRNIRIRIGIGKPFYKSIVTIDNS